MRLETGEERRFCEQVLIEFHFHAGGAAFGELAVLFEPVEKGGSVREIRSYLAWARTSKTGMVALWRT